MKRSPKSTEASIEFDEPKFDRVDAKFKPVAVIWNIWHDLVEEKNAENN